MAENKRLNKEIEEIKRLDFADLRKWAISKVQSVDFFVKKNAELREKLSELKEEKRLDEINIDCALSMCECILAVIDKYKHFINLKSNNLLREDLADISLLMIEQYVNLWLVPNR